MPSPGREYLVVFDTDAAMLDLAKGITARREVRAVFNVLDKLRALGPLLAPPHLKRLQGASDLLELRPRQGNSPSRPIVLRVGTCYVVLAVSADHATDMSAAIGRAQVRRVRYRDPRSHKYDGPHD